MLLLETVSLLLECHPELLSPYTAYGGAIYAHTPLHLASRNGHRCVIEFQFEIIFAILTLSEWFSSSSSGRWWR